MASVTSRRYSEDRLSWAHTDLFKAGLDPFSFLVFSYLAARADSNGKTWPKQSTIATDCGISERQVRSCIERLVEGNLIVVMTGGAGGRRSIYFVATRNEWLASRLDQGVEPANPAGLQIANRQILPVEPATPAGSHIRELDPEEVNPSKAQAPVFVPDPPKGKGAKPEAKTPKKKAPDPKSFLVHAPEEFRQDDAFVQAWDDWGQNRIDAKNPLNERGAKLAIGKLVKYPMKVAIEALERATMNGWTGVFPESIASGGRSGKFTEASGHQPPQDFGF